MEDCGRKGRWIRSRKLCSSINIVHSNIRSLASVFQGYMPLHACATNAVVFFVKRCVIYCIELGKILPTSTVLTD